MSVFDSTTNPDNLQVDEIDAIIAALPAAFALRVLAVMP